METNKPYPLVTVFSLIYNTGKYVIEALESIKANNYPNIDHIIIDDFSTDGCSIEIVENWIKENNYPCKFIKHSKNHGVCKTLNEILSLAEGKYIFGCSDDLILPDRIKKHVDILEQSADDVCAVYSKAYIWKDGKVYYDWLLGGDPNGVSPAGNILDNLIMKNFIPAISITVKVSCIKEVGGYDESIPYEDYQMWLKLAEKFKFIYSDYVSGIYRISGESLSSNIHNWDLSYLKIYASLKNQKNKVLSRRYLELAYKAYWSNNSEAIKFFRKDLKNHTLSGVRFVLAVWMLPVNRKIGKGLIKAFTSV